MRGLARVLGAVAVVLLVVLPAGPTTAKVVDASENSDDIPKSFNQELLTDKGGFPPRKGYEAKLKQQADLRWKHCLKEIDYAREGAGWQGVGGWVYVSEQDGECHTPQVASLHTIEQAFLTQYEISNLDIDKFMRELAGYFDFVRKPNDSEEVTEEEQEKLDEAEEDLAGDTAYDASQEAGGNKVENNAAGEAARAAVRGGASAEQVKAVTDPGGTLDELVNKLKEDSGKAITEGLGYLSKGLAFDGASRTFRDAYAAAAGVGVVVLAMGAVVALMQVTRRRRPAEEAVERLLAGLVGGVLGLLFTPAMIYLCTNAANVLSDGVVTWMGTDSEVITGSLIDPFNALTTANSPLGYLGAIVICCFFFLAGVMLLVTFAAQYLAAYFGAVGLGVTGGLVSTEKGVRIHRKALATVVTLIFARPILLFMVGVAVKLSAENAASADGWSTDPMGTLFRIIIGLGAILMVCFAPGALTRFMPVGGAGRGGGGRGMAAGLAGGLAGGSAAGAMFGQRMRSMAPSVRSAASRAADRLRGRPASRGQGGQSAGRSAGGAGHGAGRGGSRGRYQDARPPAPGRGAGGEAGSGKAPGGSEAADGTGGTRGQAQADDRADRTSPGSGSPGTGTTAGGGGAGPAAQGPGGPGGQHDSGPGAAAGAPGAGDTAASEAGGSGTAPSTQLAGDTAGGGYVPEAAGVTAASSSSSGAEGASGGGGHGGGSGRRPAGGGGSTPAPRGRSRTQSGSGAGRAGSRLTGRDLLATGSTPRRAAARTVEAAGRVGGAAASVGAAAAVATAAAARTAGYQGARFAEDVTEEAR